MFRLTPKVIISFSRCVILCDEYAGALIQMFETGESVGEVNLACSCANHHGERDTCCYFTSLGEILHSPLFSMASMSMFR